MSEPTINRGTGRTTRMMQRTVETAKRCKNVFVIIPNAPFVDYVAKMLPADAVKTGEMTYKLGECVITFLVKDADLQHKLTGLDMKVTSVQMDHACRE